MGNICRRHCRRGKRETSEKRSISAIQPAENPASFDDFVDCGGFVTGKSSESRD